MKRFFAALITSMSIACGAPPSEGPRGEHTGRCPGCEERARFRSRRTEVVERWRGKTRDRGFRGTCHQGGRSRLRSALAHRDVRQRWHALGREARAVSVAVCLRPREGAGARTSGVGDEAAILVCAEGRHGGVAATGEHGLLQILSVTHAGMTTEEFTEAVQDWITTARHPKTATALHRDGVPAHAGTSRLPPRERLQDFHRVGRRRGVHAAVGRAVYGIPPEQVVGSSGKLKFEMRDGRPGACQARRARPDERQGR